MRRPLVMGNWKMHGRRTEAALLLGSLKSQVGLLDGVDVVVCPPYPFLPMAAEAFRDNSVIAWGAQNLSAYDEGAYTGEVSGRMLHDFGCRFVIIGHSERRALFGETDDLVAMKFGRAQAEGLIPVLCVGETLAEKKANHTAQVVGNQIEAVFRHVGAQAFRNAVIAYEPVWAIGSGLAATPSEAEGVHSFIRGAVYGRDPEAASALRILYGGSVKAQNARELFAQANIDGGLIGGAALNAAEFASICHAAAKGP